LPEQESCPLEAGARKREAGGRFNATAAGSNPAAGKYLPYRVRYHQEPALGAGTGIGFGTRYWRRFAFPCPVIGIASLDREKGEAPSSGMRATHSPPWGKTDTDARHTWQPRKGVGRALWKRTLLWPPRLWGPSLPSLNTHTTVARPEWTSTPFPRPIEHRVSLNWVGYIPRKRSSRIHGVHRPAPSGELRGAPDRLSRPLSRGHPRKHTFSGGTRRVSRLKETPATSVSGSRARSTSAVAQYPWQRRGKARGRSVLQAPEAGFAQPYPTLILPYPTLTLLVPTLTLP